MSFKCVCTVQRFGGLECFVAREVDDVDGRMGRWPSDASEMRSAHKPMGNRESAKVVLHVWHCFEDVENVPPFLSTFHSTRSSFIHRLYPCHVGTHVSDISICKR